MDTILPPDLVAPSHIVRDKNQSTIFAKDVPNIARYSLADYGDTRTGRMDYHTQIITNEDKTQVLKFLRRFFFRDEPLNQCIGLIPEGEDSTCLELETYCCNSSFDNNLSVMAVSTNGAIIGVQLNGKLDPAPQEEPEFIRNCKNEKFKKILDLLHYVDKNACRAFDFSGMNMFEIRILSVDSNWRGRGVSKALIEKSFELGREQGFDVVRVDCTSNFSSRLCAKLGFKQIYQLKYTDYVDEDGKPIFSPAFPHTAVVSYVRKI